MQPMIRVSKQPNHNHNPLYAFKSFIYLATNDEFNSGEGKISGHNNYYPRKRIWNTLSGIFALKSSLNGVT